MADFPPPMEAPGEQPPPTPLEHTFPGLYEDIPDMWRLTSTAEQDDPAGKEAAAELLAIFKTSRHIPDEAVHAVSLPYEEGAPAGQREVAAALAAKHVQSLMNKMEPGAPYVYVSRGETTVRVTVGTVDEDSVRIFHGKGRGEAPLAIRLEGTAVTYSQGRHAVGDFETRPGPIGFVVPSTSPNIPVVEKLKFLQRTAQGTGNFAVGPSVPGFLSERRNAAPEVLFYGAVGALLNNVAGVEVSIGSEFYDLVDAIPSDTKASARQTILTALALELTESLADSEVIAALEDVKLPPFHRFRSTGPREKLAALAIADLPDDLQDLEQYLRETILQLNRTAMFSGIQGRNALTNLVGGGLRRIFERPL